MNRQNFSAKSFKITIFIFVILLSTSTIFAASGDVDTTFNASAFNSINGSVNVFKKQTDGKILFGGSFTVVNGFARSGIARLNVDGSLDTTFDPPDFFNGLGLGRTVNSIGIQSDGKIIVGGSLYGTSYNYAPGLRRLNTDGSLDTSFVARIQGNLIVWDLEIQSDDKIIIGGDFQISNTVYNNLARLNSNGTLDTSFAGNFNAIVKQIELQTDGKLVVGGGNTGSTGYLIKLNNDGTSDSSFSAGSINNSIESMVTQPDGKILIGGAFTGVNGFQVGRIARILANGSLDTSFNLNLIGANSTIYGISLGANGKIAITGLFSSFNGVQRNKVAQLNADGSLDTSFNTVFPQIILGYVVNILPNGRILLGLNGDRTSALVQLNTDGTIDNLITYSVGSNGSVSDIIQQPDGKIIVSGEFTKANNVTAFNIARYNLDGSLDTTFTPFSFPSKVTALALQNDGKILAGLNAGTALSSLIRLNTDGSRDSGFSPNLGSIVSAIYDIEVSSDGKILVAGDFTFPNKKITRLNSNGSNDTTFVPTQPDNIVRKLFIQPDGKILIGGDFTQITPFIRNRIAKLNADGSIDGSFNPPGGANNTVNDIDIQSDGKIIIGGLFTALNGSNSQKYVGRYNTDGSLDTTFSSTIDMLVNAVKIQPNGKILVGGNVLNSVSLIRKGLERLNSNGSTDTTFNVGTGVNENVFEIILQSDGKILVGGRFTRVNGQSHLSIARLLNNSVSNSRTSFDFDGDGRSDVSVFRASSNRWYELLSSNSQVSEATFGVSGDVVAPADFDGDGKTDLAIFRPSTGNWWYLSSVDNTQRSTQFGTSGDIPRPSDFDGDGRDDFVVFRPSNSLWYRLSSGNGAVSVVAFGTISDKPVIGDFDGDGKSDVAIFRPSTGTWWYQSSIDNVQRATQFGISTDIPVPADYDGDGKTDLAVYRPSTGVWYILNSSTGQATIVGFGLTEDKPVAADYDGDGKADIAVFRPSTGIWYLLRSTSGFTALQFGISTDTPIQNSLIQ